MSALPSSVVHVIMYWLNTPLISEGCFHVTKSLVGSLGKASTVVGALGAGTRAERFAQILNVCFLQLYNIEIFSYCVAAKLYVSSGIIIYH